MHQVVMDAHQLARQRILLASMSIVARTLLPSYRVHNLYHGPIGTDSKRQTNVVEYFIWCEL